MSTDEKIALADYPCHAPGKVEVLKAETIYKFLNDKGTFGRWQAVVFVRSFYTNRETKEQETGVSVRVYRWVFKKPTKWNPDTRKRITDWDAESKWFQEQELTINKKEYVDKITKAILEFAKEV